MSDNAQSETTPARGAARGSAAEFFVVNLSHSNREHHYITFWRPDDKGYAYPLSWSGRYERARILESLDYYNGGENIAVRCEVVEQLAVAPAPGMIDGDAGPVVPNRKECWDVLLANKIAETKYKPKPMFRRAQRTGTRTSR